MPQHLLYGLEVLTYGLSWLQSYDSENRLVVVTDTVTMAVTRFYYDADGNRVRQVAPDGTSTVYIGQWYEESQSVSQGNVRTNYYYFGGQRVALRTGAVGQAGVVYYLHTDHLGSLSEATTASGELYTRQRYYPYGLVRYLWGRPPTTYNYTGQRLDGTGLLYYGARYYHPLLGRFTQADTIVPQPGNPQSLNRYAYVTNNPLRHTDPSGHWVETVWDIVSIGWDVYEVSRDPGNVWNWVALAADVGAVALPGVPAVAGVVARGGKAAKAAVEVASHADEVVDAGRAVAEIASHVDEVAKVASYADEVADTLKAAARSPYAIGRAGEEAVGITGPKTRITLPTGRFRVPDQVDRAAEVVREVKNVARLSYTRQLRDYALWAQHQGYTFELIVRQTTRLSRPLQEAIERGEIILIRRDLPW